MDINSLTAAKIKEIRKKLGLTAESVAADIGITKSSYSRLENGQTELTLLKVETLAKLFHISISDLIPGFGGNHQVSHGSGGNFVANSNMTNNFFAGKDDATSYIVETLTGIINDLKKPSE